MEYAGEVHHSLDLPQFDLVILRGSPDFVHLGIEKRRLYVIHAFILRIFVSLIALNMSPTAYGQRFCGQRESTKLELDPSLLGDAMTSRGGAGIRDCVPRVCVAVPRNSKRHLQRNLAANDGVNGPIDSHAIG